MSVRLFVIVVVFVSVVASNTAAATKYIFAGWDISDVTPQEILENADKFDAAGCDGVAIGLANIFPSVGQDIRKSFHIAELPRWKDEDVSSLKPVLKKFSRHRGLHHSFFRVNLAPRKSRLAWNDDAAWALCAENLAAAARLAKEVSFEGLVIDPEDYHKNKQNRLAAGDPPWVESKALARRRGCEIFSRVFAEYPDITILSFMLLTADSAYAQTSDPVAYMESKRDLWPSFVNGILDILPPEARVNDGQEDSYHSSAAKLGYRNDAYMFHALYPKLVDPANLEKYRRQVGYAPAVYMEMFLNKEGSTWYKGPTNGSRVETLRADLVQATDVCGGYVWFWGEKHTWLNRGKNWHKPDHRIKDTTWAQELPGLFRAMAWAKDPVALYDSEVAALKQKGEPKNCVETTSVTVTNGYKTVSLKNVKGGEWYAIGYDAKGASAKMNIFFKDAKRKYVQPSINLIYPDDGRGVVRVPDGGANGTLVFSAKNRPGEKTVFDSIHAYRIASEETEKKVSEEKEAVK